MGLVSFLLASWIVLQCFVLGIVADIAPTATPPPDFELRPRQDVGSAFLGYTLFDGECKIRQDQMFLVLRANRTSYRAT
jgi:hypothetical protein